MFVKMKTEQDLLKNNIKILLTIFTSIVILMFFGHKIAFIGFIICLLIFINLNIKKKNKNR